MRQGFKGSAHTYAQFTDLIFGPLPKSETMPRTDLIIETHESNGFSPFMDDHIGGFTDFDTQFRFLHKKYFPQIAFGLVYVSGAKTKAFVKTLELIGFMRSSNSLWPSI